MKRNELIADMKRHTKGGFITRKQLADYMTVKDAHSVDRYLYGLTAVNKRYYFIPDVADVLIREERSF